VRGVMSEILTKGRVVRGWIGIVPADIDQLDAQRFNLPQSGVVITKLYLGSPAAQAGMEPRDMILTVNGVKVVSAQDALTRIANAKPGKKVKITGLRGTESFATDVEVGERPRSTS
jgi:S1-C subfamily serine protease